jgi:hypothetical protein
LNYLYNLHALDYNIQVAIFARGGPARGQEINMEMWLAQIDRL